MSLKDKFDLGFGPEKGLSRREFSALRIIELSGKSGTSINVLKNRMRIGGLDNIVKIADVLIEGGYIRAISIGKYRGCDIVKLYSTRDRTAK